MKSKTVLVTGASGFIGSGLRSHAEMGGWVVRAAARRPCGRAANVVGEIGPDTEWSDALKGVDAAVHLAARVHVVSDLAADPLAEFRRVNVEGTRNLAAQAANAGVRRFVYLSSVKVNGEQTRPGRPFEPDAAVLPVDPYGISKCEAEQALQAVGAETGMEVVIVRPPLVYGPGVKANFLRLLQWVERGIPLPLASIENRRSLIGLRNLADFIVTCLDHPKAAGQTFLVSDGEDLATPDLIRRLAHHMGRPARLVPVPPRLIRASARMLGREAVVDRLCASLQVDITKTRELLEWTPPYTVDEELARTVKWYRASRGKN